MYIFNPVCFKKFNYRGLHEYVTWCKSSLPLCFSFPESTHLPVSMTMFFLDRSQTCQASSVIYIVSYSPIHFVQFQKKSKIMSEDYNLKEDNSDTEKQELTDQIPLQSRSLPLACCNPLLRHKTDDATAFALVS